MVCGIFSLLILIQPLWAADPRASEQVALTAIHQPEGEALFFHPLYGIRSSPVVAVLDSGVQLDHPDLMSRLWRAADGTFGFDFIHGTTEPWDDSGHGTHVAGLIAAQRDNDLGIRGVMGDAVRIMAVKTQAADGSGTLAGLVSGIRWAVDHGADVLNLSIASTEQDAALREAIEYALQQGATIVAAAGNRGQEISSTAFYVPAGLAPEYPGLISVGAFDAVSLQKPPFSNYGPRFVEMSAPGSAGINGILSTYWRSSYAGLNGTSQSAPQVSAAAALTVAYLRTHGRSHSPIEIEEYLQLSADEDAGLATAFQNGRRLNVLRLGRLLMRSTVIDSTGGFDGP